MRQEAVTRNRERYDQAFALLDEVRAKVLALLRTLTQAQAGKRPAENEWSIAEIADHLALTERAYMAGVADLAANADPNKFDYDEVLRSRRFRIEDLGDPAITGKFATPPQLLPTAGKPLPDLFRALDEARSQSKRILLPYRDQDLGIRFFHHPKVGPITLYERMANIAYHELKHLRQMERTLARLGGDASPRSGPISTYENGHTRAGGCAWPGERSEPSRHRSDTEVSPFRNA